MHVLPAVTSHAPPAAGSVVGQGTSHIHRSPPAGPATLKRGGTPTYVVTDPATDTLHFSVQFNFILGQGGYQWKLNYCTRDSESLDGLGLPGHHGCGDPTVSASAPYLG